MLFNSGTRTVVFVDAGYVLSSVAANHHVQRWLLKPDYPSLIKRIKEQTEAVTGAPPVRVLWYDATKTAQLTPDYWPLAAIDDVKVRLGHLVFRNDRWSQKGVDSFVQRDMNVLATRHACTDMVLITGDEDLRRAVEDVQDWGVRVHVWGVSDKDGDPNQSPRLLNEADRRDLIAVNDLFHVLTPPAAPVKSVDERVSEETPASVPSGDHDATASTAEVDGGQRASADEGESAAASPETVEVPEAPAEQLTDSRGSNAQDKATAAPAPAAPPTPATPGSIRRKFSLTSQTLQGLSDRQLAAHVEQWREVMPPVEPRSAGNAYGKTWLSLANDEERKLALESHPRVPPMIDKALIAWAYKIGHDTEEPTNTVKWELRQGFWDALSERM